MKFLTGLFILAISSAAFAGDKIGNGGGLWACVDSKQNITSASLVDLYEAENEFGLDLVTTSQTNPMNIVSERGLAIEKSLPDYAKKWNPYMTEVLTKMRQVNSELVIIDDALFRIKPLPSTCVGTWQYTQFANFTDMGQVLIRKDLWNNSAVAALDKAALIWHEVIYRWLRVEYHETDSVHAREIVGILFSDLSPAEMKSRIDALLASDPAKPPASANPTPVLPTPPPAPSNQWICMVKNNLDALYYSGYGMGQMMAEASADQACQNSPDPFHCDSFGATCEQITRETKSFVCIDRNNLTSKDFSGVGRSRLEAEFLARKACQDEGNAYHCSQLPDCQDEQ